MNRIEMNKITSQQIKNLFSLPLNELIFKAQEIHKKNFKDGDVQLASLISIKTGSCPEDCKYCPQSAHYNVNLKKENLIDIKEDGTFKLKMKYFKYHRGFRMTSKKFHKLFTIKVKLHLDI